MNLAGDRAGGERSFSRFSKQVAVERRREMGFVQREETEIVDDDEVMGEEEAAKED